jgi:histidine triad (HIT) family protein
MSDCIFCKIASGEIPSNKVYEDDLVVAFHDISPQAPVHVLVIPKKHIDSVAEINAGNSSIVAHIFEVIAPLQKKLNLENGFRVISNCGENAGQTVKHLHFHIIGGKTLGVKIV